MTGRAIRRIIAWGTVVVVTGGLYALAPYGPDIQTALLARLGATAYLLIPAPFALAAGFLLVQRIRQRPGDVLRTLVAFALFGALYASCLRLVERPIEQVHFLLYGVLSGIIFWALSMDLAGWVLYPWTLLVVFLIGMGDELIQWWLPNRVADFHDVLFDALGGALGLSFVALSMRPQAARGPLQPRQARGLAGGIILVALATGAFITSVHEFGYPIRDPEVGSFLSLFSSEELGALNAARLEALGDAGARDPRLQRFDMEARRHIRLQERYLKEGRGAESASEQAIVHQYYGAYLQVPGHLPEPDLPPGTPGKSPATFQSEAYQGKIYTGFGAHAVWFAVAAVILGAVGIIAGSGRAMSPPDSSGTPSSASGAPARHPAAEGSAT
jgi:VanZ family protein